MESRVEGRGALSRRRVIAGAAWAAPVVLVAAAAPAAATSPEPTLALSPSGSSVAHKSKTFTLTGRASKPLAGGFYVAVSLSKPGATLSVPAGSAWGVSGMVLTHAASVAASGAVSVTFTATWGRNDHIAEVTAALSLYDAAGTLIGTAAAA
ncbi:hypothetical protein [Demequina iriomotensis]|uniref:hypothetical protein n=1 Tax=Demequina iriomotensis TaxID=1536641 RepID=UPI000781AA29|nr:hypothetical protein [Demequina iriomotensis]